MHDNYYIGKSVTDQMADHTNSYMHCSMCGCKIDETSGKEDSSEIINGYIYCGTQGCNNGCKYKYKLRKMTNNKEMFPVTHICKEDIIHAFEESDIFEQVKKKVKTMDNNDMVYLARELADDYCEQLFWSSLKVIFEERFIEEK